MNGTRTGIACSSMRLYYYYYYCCYGNSSQLIMVDFSEPCLVLRDLLCRRYGVRNPSLCGLRYEGEQELEIAVTVDVM